MAKYKPGESGNPAGRPKGSRNKLSQAFIDALAKDFQENGEEVVEQVRLERPNEYLKIVGQLVPKEIDLTGEVTQRNVELTEKEATAINKALEDEY